MALINDLPKQKTVSDKGIWLLGKDVITSMAQYTELVGLLKPYSEDKEHVLVEMVGKMTIDQGSPNAVAPGLDAADKQTIYDGAVAKLKALQPDKPKEVEAAPKKAEAADGSGLVNSIQKFFKGQVGPEILASGGIAAAAGLFSKFTDRDDRPTTEVAEGAARAVVKEGEEIAPRATRAAGRSFWWLAKWLLIGLAVIALLPLVFGPIGLIPAGIVVWIGFIVYSKAKNYPDTVHQTWLRKVGDKLPVALQLTGVTFIDLADRTNSEDFAKVVKFLEGELSTWNPFDDEEEEEIDSLLHEMVAIVTQHYGDVVLADMTISQPTFRRFPPEVYPQADSDGF